MTKQPADCGAFLHHSSHLTLKRQIHPSAFLLLLSEKRPCTSRRRTDIGLRAAVKAPARRPDGTWNIKLTVAVFRPWRGSQATIASDPAFNAAPWFARPHRRLGEEFDPAIAGCWCREPLPPRLARPKDWPDSSGRYSKNWSRWPRTLSGRPALPQLPKTGADGQDRTDDLLRTSDAKFGAALPSSRTL